MNASLLGQVLVFFAGFLLGYVVYRSFYPFFGDFFGPKMEFFLAGKMAIFLLGFRCFSSVESPKMAKFRSKLFVSRIFSWFTVTLLTFAFSRP